MTPLDRLNEHIDQLVIWLRDNQSRKLHSNQKDRLKNILNAIINKQTLTAEEIEKLKSESDRKTKTPPKVSLSCGYVLCEHCGDKLNIKNQIKHQKKCRGITGLQKNTSPKPNKQAKRKPKNGIYTDKPYFNERKEERRLDGSKDYWQIRERGKSGSHSSYDNMGDESFP